MTVKEKMSNKQNDLYLEELKRAEQDYQDDLEALKLADIEFRDAYEWKRKMELNANASAKKLLALKNKDAQNPNNNRAQKTPT